MGSPLGVSVHTDSKWKYLGRILVPLPGSLIDHSNPIATSKHVELVVSEDAYIVRCKDTGYVSFMLFALYGGVTMLPMHAGVTFLFRKSEKKIKNCI